MLFLSIHPKYVQAILEGRKTVELRKRRPSAAQGTQIVIYATLPQCEVVATATLAKLEVASPCQLWQSIGSKAAISKSQFDEYFGQGEQAVGIHLSDIQILDEPLPLSQLRRAWQNFQPPQQYRYLDVNQQQLVRIAPATPRIDGITYRQRQSTKSQAITA